MLGNILVRHRFLALLTLRSGVVLSFLAAALGGAVLAMQLRPDRQVVDAHPRHVVATRLARPRPVATPIPAPAAPTHAMLAVAGGRTAPRGAWLPAHILTLRVTLSPPPHATMLFADVELRPLDEPFTGEPTISSSAVPSEPGLPRQVTIAASGLVDGQRYHWRARTRTVDGRTSGWSGDGLFGVSTVAPLPPELAATNIALHSWSAATRALFRWTDSGSALPIHSYEYALLPGGTPKGGAHWRQDSRAALAVDYLTNGRWNLLVRAVDLAGNRSAPAVWPFAIARVGPHAPAIVSAVPAQGAWGNVAVPELAWQASPMLAPIRSYEYALIPGTVRPPNVPLQWHTAAASPLRIPHLADGSYLVLVRAVDMLGHRSRSLEWPFHLDRRPPSLTRPALSAPNFTPPSEPITLTLSLSETSTITYTIANALSHTVVLAHSLGVHRSGTVTVRWNGRLGHQRLAPAGSYILTVAAIDRAGNRAQMRTQAFALSDKRILVSISKEKLWAYQGNKLILQSLVTNGGTDTPTIPGIYHVQEKLLNWVMHSPWPKGSPLWYPDSPTNYDLLYNADGGYFIHDAPWRSVYGPGSNSTLGTPGGDYTGTHGCTNVPTDVMAKLYAWANVGTLIQISP